MQEECIFVGVQIPHHAQNRVYFSNIALDERGFGPLTEELRIRWLAHLQSVLGR